MSDRRRLPLMGRLDRYVVAHFIGSYGTALFMLVGLFLIMDMAANLDNFLEADDLGRKVAMSTIARYYLLSVPFLFLQVAPFVTLLAGMFTVVKLLKKNEISPVLSAGISVYRLLVPIYLMGLLLGVGMFALREYSVDKLADKRNRMLYMLESRESQRVLEGIVVHDLSKSTVFLERFFPDEPRPRVEAFSAVLRLVSARDRAAATVSVHADEALWDPAARRWDLVNGQRRIVGEQAVEEVGIDVLEGFEFTPALALTYARAANEPLELSFAEVEQLMQREPEDSAFRTLWHYLLTFPLANVVLLLVGLPILFQYERGQGTERMALGGLFCIFYFATDFVFRTFGLGGGISPVLAGWVPVLVVGSLGVALTDGIRT